MNTGKEIPAEAGDDNDVAGAIRVECHAGYRAEESPRCFFLGARAIAVTEVIDRWLDPEHSYFKVRGDDGGIYILRHDHGRGLWQMLLFSSGSHAGTRLSST
jgi:hypothetical protein